MEENTERCLKCGEEQGLQGIAVTKGRKTFHPFYLCTKYGNVTVEELLKVIRAFEEMKKIK